MLVTKKEISMNFRGYEITIPKGIKTTHKTACGIDERYNFIDDLTWIPKDENGNKQYFLIHDATYYGINISRDLLEEI
jgi:hypothetical protein